MLEGWAVQEGVQSTTRYRKANSRRHHCANRSQPFALELRPISPGVLASHGNAWRHRDVRLRGPAYAYGVPLGAFTHDVAPERPLPSTRSTTPGICRDNNYSLFSAFTTDGMNPPRPECHGLPLDHGYTHSNTFSIMVPHQDMPTSMPTTMAPLRTHTISGDVSAPLYYNIAQGPYPYNVADVHVGYSEQPPRSDDKNFQAPLGPRQDGLCPFGEEGI
jgi:hypothetical protein